MKKGIIQIDGKFYKECDVIMLPSNIKGHNYKQILQRTTGEEEKLFLAPWSDKEGQFDNIHKSQHLYILSNEEIKEGDWVKHGLLDLIYQVNKDNIEASIHNKSKKIIATTDTNLNVNVSGENSVMSNGLPRPSNEFLQAYVKAQGKIDKVLVEYIEEGGWLYENNYESDEIHPQYILKVSPDSTITIKPVKEKTFTREEVIELVKKALEDCNDLVLWDSDGDGNQDFNGFDNQELDKFFQKHL